ncbi:hypothetical protein [Tepidanaerobacter syntrophicus]|uniref:Uncharacterized protein n=1 Tax=Tepidanaerobacter syntrophicus TaxID=224999 RepID=A0A0U9HG20_9FIRM|nr:hypothetical protein [Tepidanaerobacter syntrophicus]GAQ24220.1 hypothetical protein TSYNT_546 [Tepidanaerobacter syntrophicus]
MSKKKKTSNTTNVDIPNRVIYCGPNLPGGAMLRYTVYNGGIPEHLDPLISQCPAIKHLIVPVDKFTETERKIGIAGTPENTYFAQISRFIKEHGRAVN